MDEAQVAELGKQLGVEAQKRIDGVQANLEKQIKQIEEQHKTDGKVSEDAVKNLSDLMGTVKRIEEEFGKKFSEMTVKMNREGLPFGSGEQRQKGLENLIYDTLKSAQEKGDFNEVNQTGSKKYPIKSGHGALHQKAVGVFTSGNLTDGAGNAAFSAREIRSTVVTSPSPSIHVRNLLNTSVMSQTYLEYPQFIGGEGTPGYQVNQGDTKAQIDYDFQMIPVRPKTLAAWTRVSRQALNDISWLANFFSTQMMLDLLKKEDAELLNGTGVNSIKGIIPSATDYVPTDGGYATLFEYLVDGIAQLESKDYQANGIVMHPLDYARLLVYKTTTGEFNYPGLVFGGSERSLLTFNGTPIYKLNQIAQGKTVIGDWNRAELLIREGINFGLFYEDADNVTKNLVTLRIEEEIGLAVYHPQAFLDMDITAVTSGI